MSTDAPTFDAFGETFTVHRKPPTLLLSELARTGSGDPNAVGVIAEFFEFVLTQRTAPEDGGEPVFDAAEYRRFKRTAYNAAEDEGALAAAVQAALEASFATPTR